MRLSGAHSWRDDEVEDLRATDVVVEWRTTSTGSTDPGNDGGCPATGAQTARIWNGWLSSHSRNLTEDRARPINSSGFAPCGLSARLSGAGCAATLTPPFWSVIRVGLRCRPLASIGSSVG